jgi:hypothetical protein
VPRAIKTAGPTANTSRVKPGNGIPIRVYTPSHVGRTFRARWHVAISITAANTDQMIRELMEVWRCILASQCDGPRERLR